MNRILNLYHTIKYLKPIQLKNRVSRKLSKVSLRDLFIELNSTTTCWQPFAVLPSCYQGSRQFKFLNVVDVVSDWNDKNKAKLWLYNLHYFDDLNQLGWQDRTDIHTGLIDTWIAQNPPMMGNGWEPYTISLRSVNWIKWFLSGNEPKSEWVSSLSLQVQALDQQLEYHLLGNHLFANAKGLVFAGCFFKGKDAKAWLKRGLAILEKEVPEQILADGGNFELTPMYHNTILADILDLYHLSLVYPDLIPSEIQSAWYEYILKMFKWAEQMEHPDGDISFFNDSAFGIAPRLKSLKEYAEILNIELAPPIGEQVTLLKDSGYVVAKVNEIKLITDVAKVGPDYIPGHAHADTLSFEFSIGNQRVFVNSGTSIYGLGEERLRQRKTETHNTVVVDGEDSSEVWSGFRVARRAYPSNVEIKVNEQTVSVECSHDGYMRLPGKVIHTRNWQLTPESLVVSDSLTGKFNDAQAHYHLHPDIQVLNDDELIIQLPDNRKYGVKVEGGDTVILDSTWHPEFGLSVANKKLLVDFKQNEVTFVLERIT
ncbi:alginate lyase family protein [Vibrio sp. ED004]|uniref:heparinase II/III family protein n=1 Tax=Vibrio sp. ED004 TaxID=2785124 RepID=UPI00204F61F1|nr:heparinase II/III family protein [Vibrio sp. ED004]UPR55354.1 alginate lyase family protein [Vibrio sp. ED004]